MAYHMPVSSPQSITLTLQEEFHYPSQVVQGGSPCTCFVRPYSSESSLQLSPATTWPRRQLPPPVTRSTISMDGRYLRSSHRSPKRQLLSPRFFSSTPQVARS